MNDNISWLDALKNLPSKGYRQVKGGGFEAFVSDHSRTVFLGTHSTIENARDAVLNYRIDRLITAVERYGLNIDESKVFMNKYLAFENGMIFNLHGELMQGGVDRCGYIHGLLDNRNMYHHRVIATLFCKRDIGNDYVNHIDGNKQNNSSDNLEWVTRSENTKHSYRLGLQKSTGTGMVYTDAERDYIREHCFDDYNDVANHLGKSKETIRKYMARCRKEKGND